MKLLVTTSIWVDDARDVCGVSRESLSRDDPFSELGQDPRQTGWDDREDSVPSVGRGSFSVSEVTRGGGSQEGGEDKEGREGQST